MKKSLFYLSMLSMALVIVACNTEGEDVTITNELASSPSAPALKSNLTDAFTLRFHAPGARFKEIAFTETHKAIVTLNKQSSDIFAKRRAGSEDVEDEYIVGTYTFDSKNNTYTIKDEEGKDYCTVEVTNKETSKTITAKVHMMTGDEIEEFDAEIAEKLESNTISTRFCREWQVVNTRLRHKDGVTAIKHFEDPTSAASLNDILDYAKTVATITEDLAEGTAITSIEFTSDGKFCFFFENGNHYIGKWSWADPSKGYINYDWDDEEMGNKFMKEGQAIFDVRTHKKVKYYTLTLAAQIEESDKTYKVELSFYLNEKAK